MLFPSILLFQSTRPQNVGGRLGPPVEAVSACAGQSAGANCGFTAPQRGDQISGICGVTPGATGEIQNRPRPSVGEDLVDKIDVGFGFAPIPVGVEIQILLAEPLLVPGHGGNDSGFVGEQMGVGA